MVWVRVIMNIYLWLKNVNSVQIFCSDQNCQDSLFFKKTCTILPFWFFVVSFLHIHQKWDLRNLILMSENAFHHGCDLCLRFVNQKLWLWKTLFQKRYVLRMGFKKCSYILQCFQMRVFIGTKNENSWMQYSIHKNK